MRQAALMTTHALQTCPMRPSWRRGRKISSSARGAKPQAHHGPLERLLEVTLTTSTVRGRRGHRKRTRFSVLSVPMEAINEAASRLLDRCLTDATGTRPDAHRSRGGRTRTSDAPNEDACQRTGAAIVRSTQSQAKAFPILRGA